MILQVPMDPRLKREIKRLAFEEGVAMNTVVVRAIAKAIGRPDLALVPYGKRGRPVKGSPLVRVLLPS